MENNGMEENWFSNPNIGFRYIYIRNTAAKSSNSSVGITLKDICRNIRM